MGESYKVLNLKSPLCCPYCSRKMKTVGVWQQKDRKDFFISIADTKGCTKVFAIHELVLADFFTAQQIRWIIFDISMNQKVKQP